MEQAQREGADLPSDPKRSTSTAATWSAWPSRRARRREQGKMDEARKRMAELEQMLDQLRNARAGARPGEAPQRRAAAARPAADGRAAGHDRPPGRAARPCAERAPGTPGDQDGEPRAGQPDAGRGGKSPERRPGGAAREADRRVQQALRRALGELMQQFGDLTGQVPPSLGEADQAMRDAGQALGEGQDDAAGHAEQRAIEALQKGGQRDGPADGQAVRPRPARRGRGGRRPERRWPA